MRFSRHTSAILLGLGIVAAAGSSAAWGQEQLVMPFACDAHGGGVRLYPAPQQSYRIYGTREHKMFSYCSPNTPDRCHNWMLHRFDLDCSGVRVPWIRVAEAAAQPGRAWVEDGRMSLQMGAVWASPQEERHPRRRWWFERRRQLYDERFDDRGSFERPVGSPRDVVELPPGFAPVLGTRAQFAGVPPAEMSSGPAERDADIAAVAPAKPPALAPQKREATLAAQPKEPSAQAIKPPAPTPAKREPVKAAEPVQAGEQSALKPDKVAAPPVKDEKAATPAPKAVEAPSGTSVTPTIINRPKDTSAPPAGDSAAAAGSSVAQKSGAATVAAAEPTAAASEHPVSADAAKTQIAEAPAQELPLDKSATNPIATGSLQDGANKTGTHDLLHAQTLTIGFVLFGVLAASSFVFWSRRQERARLGTLVRRDIASVSFGGEPRTATLPAPLGPHHPHARPESARAVQAELSEISLEIPLTPAEALQVLGASPDASIDVIKKIVDGLRQSWHPDLAKSEDDRLYREQRVKQINVAWDLLSGRRSAA